MAPTTSSLPAPPPPPPLGKRSSDASPSPPAAKKARRSSSSDALPPAATPLHEPLSPAAAALIPALVSPTTADEMEQFLETCVQWQANLSKASRAVDENAARLEQREVALALDGLVTQVEQRALAERDAELEALRAVAAQQTREAERAMRRLQQQQEERDAFEALERRLLDDRVAELEVQLAQNKLRELEKDAEICKLRVEQDELSASSCVVPRAEWDAHLVEHQRLGSEADAWRRRCEALEDTRAFEDLEKRVLEERVEELSAQLATEAEQRRAALSEELEAAQLQLSVAGAEAAVKKNEVARLLNDKTALKKQAKTLASELKRAALDADACKAELSAERARASQLADDNARLRDELQARAQQQQQKVETLRTQEQLRADNDARRDEELERLTWKERALTKQLTEAADARATAVAAAVAQLQEQHDRQLADLGKQQQRKRPRDASDALTTPEEPASERVARLELEKREILAFFRCYYEASETKCRQLLHELSQQHQQEGTALGGVRIP